MDKVKSQIINFMIKQIQKQKLNPELIIFLLQNSPNEKFSSYILNQIDSLIMKKEDFYEKGENQKYLFFKLFFEKCSDLLKNNEIYQGYYLTETVMVMTSILYEIKNHDIIYQLINDLIESKGFYKKLEFLCNGFSNENPNKIYFELKKEVEICRRKILELEKLNDYLYSFL